MKLAIYAFLFLAPFASNAFSEELFVECQFENSKLSSGDADAAAWLNDLSFRRHKFVYQTEPPKVLDGPGAESFWGEPRITVGKQELEFE